MVVLDVCLDNFYAFKNFHINFTYPKKIVDSSIQEEYLPERPNFRYKKVNIIMGANASGKTTFGRVIMKIFNFLDKKNYERITDIISDKSKEASFVLDLASRKNIFYRITCRIAPLKGEKYTSDDIYLEIRQKDILIRDSYESCTKRLEEMEYTPKPNYIDELENLDYLDWMFEYPQDTDRILKLPDKDPIFLRVLDLILKALDPSIQSVEISRDVARAYVIRLYDRSVILQDKEPFVTNLLSSGTKAGVEIAGLVSSLIKKDCTFYYCDEKFSYIHSELEKAVLSVMIDCIGSGDQLFFTTHNTDILEMNLPKHSFTFLRKDVHDSDCPITAVSASSVLKRSTDSLKNAVENDLFSTAPAVDLVFAITDP